MKLSIARGLAAQCWRDPRTSDRVMDPELAEVFAEKLTKYSRGIGSSIAECLLTAALSSIVVLSILFLSAR